MSIYKRWSSDEDMGMFKVIAPKTYVIKFEVETTEQGLDKLLDLLCVECMARQITTREGINDE